MPMRLYAMPAGALIAALACSFPASAFDASRDPAFGQAGVQVIDQSQVMPRSDRVFVVGKRPGGGYVALSGRYTAVNDDFAFVARLAEDGALLGELQLPTPTVYVGAAAVDAQGRVVIASIAFLPANRVGVRVERRLDTGVLDASFGGGDGFTVLDEAGFDIRGNALAFDAQQRIAVGGSALAAGGVQGPDTRSFAALLDAAGTPVAAFGGNGIATFDIAPQLSESVSAVTLAPGGQVLLCGSILAGGSSTAAFVRLAPDGQGDAGFGNGGIATYDTDVPGENWGDNCRDLAFHPGNGRLHAAVERRLGGPIKGAVRALVLTEAGTFNGNVPDLLVSEGYPGRVRLAFDAERRVLLATTLKDVGGRVDPYVLRLLEFSLFPDGDFGTGGSESYPVFLPGAIRRDADQVASLLVDKGRVVVASTHGESGTDSLWAVQRLQGTALFASGFE
jgi:hypothetical protein